MKRVVIAFVICLALVMSLVGCTKAPGSGPVESQAPEQPSAAPAETSAAAEPGDAKGLHVVYIPIQTGNPYFDPISQGLQDVVEAAGGTYEMTAADVYGQWESELYDTAIVAQGVRTMRRDETVVENGSIKYGANGAPVTRTVTVEELCDASEAERIETFPLRVFKPGGSGRVLRRLIYGFITFGDGNETVNVFDDYENRVREKYAKEPDAADHIEAEIKIAIATFGGVLRKINGEMFMRAVMRKLHPDANDRQIADAVERDVAMFRESYFNEYLPACIDRNIPRFKFPEYLISQTLPTYLEHGFPNPFSEILK